MFPVFYKDDAFEENSKNSFYYVMAQNGTFLIKKFDHFEACVKVDGFSWLREHQESLLLKFPKIPQSLIEVSMGFFYEIYQRYHAEAILLLFYSPFKGFKIGIPKQYTFRAPFPCAYWLKYKTLKSPPGYFRLGSWHSHAQMDAGHSHVDDLDEIQDDGLHIVCGNLDSKDPSFSASFVVNGTRFLLNKEDVLEDFRSPQTPVPKAWIKKVHCIFHFESPTSFSNGIFLNDRINPSGAS